MSSKSKGGKIAGVSGDSPVRSRQTSSVMGHQRSLLPKPNNNLCTYNSYECSGDKLSGYEFCVRHILNDKTAPFKSCGYSADGHAGVKCTRPAPYYNRGDSYCTQHTRSILTTKQKSNRKRKSTPQVLLDSLSPYKKTKSDEEDGVSSVSVSAVNPFNQHKPHSESDGLGIAALESDGIQTENENILVSQSWTGAGEGDSEGDSLDSDAEDSLQHAGVYTVEEVMRTMKDKLVKLQKLYYDQFQRLVYKMKESRREYLCQLRQEKDAELINIFDQPNRDLEYERLKAMMHFYSTSGREALLATKHREKRMTLSGQPVKQTSFCQHTLTTTTKCSAPCIPMAKFCMKHILEEPGQVLFRACGVITPADGPCETPVAGLFPESCCVFHTKLPDIDFSSLKTEQDCESIQGSGAEVKTEETINTDKNNHKTDTDQHIIEEINSSDLNKNSSDLLDMSDSRENEDNDNTKTVESESRK